MARAQFSDTIQQIITDSSSRKIASPLDNVRVQVFKLDATGARLGAAPTLYTTRAGGGTVPNPFLTSNGVMEFWAEAGQYEFDFVDQNVPKRIADKTIGWQAVSGMDGGIGKSQLPETGNSLNFVGALQSGLRSSAPAGWLLCNGAAVSRTTYDDLYAVVGDVYGSGNGTTTFNLPDLKGRAPLGAGAAVGVNASGSGAPSGTAGTARSLGAWGGEEKHLLLATESGIKSHAVAINDPGHRHFPFVIGQVNGNANLQNTGSDNWVIEANARYVANSSYAATGGLITNSSTGISASVGAANADNSHNVVQPFVVVNFFVKY